VQKLKKTKKVKKVKKSAHFLRTFEEKLVVFCGKLMVKVVEI
jgi:hypothetical protein